jgi:hypothetical protein
VSDYTPVALPGDVQSATASTAITGGWPLVVTGNGIVGQLVPAATPALNMVGIAAEDAPSGARVTYYCQGAVHESIADGVITAGDQVVTAQTAGRQVRTLPASAGDLGAAFAQVADNLVLNTAVNNARSVLGVALTSAADNAKVRWMQT